MEKRGAARGVTNIEMIIAMTLFIFSIVLVIYYINFIGIEREPSDILLDLIEKNLREETEISYNLTYLVINYSDSALCFNITKHSSIIEENNTFIKEAEIVFFNITDNRLLISNSGGQLKHYSIYTFPFSVVVLNPFNPQSCSVLSEEAYNYSISYQDKIFVYENLTQLLVEDYDSLKESWNFKEDFSINLSITVTGQSLGVSGVKPLQAAVKARQFSIKIINKIGDMFDGIVNIQVW